MSVFSNDLFKKIQRIQFVSTQLAKDILAGAYRSAFKGRGIEFEEVREYTPGDDIRTIDWNVTARMQNPYVKVFREERDLTVILLVDISASTRFGSHYHSKQEFISEIGAVLAFSAIRNYDRIGLILFSDQIEAYFPAKKGTRHVLRLIRELLAFQPKRSGSDLKAALSFLGKVQSRSTICFLISDFLFNIDYAHQAAVAAKHHDLISLCITDPLEHQYPDVGIAHFNDLETGQLQYIDTSSRELQKDFNVTARSYIDKHRSLWQSLGKDFIQMQTDQPYIQLLRKFFLFRKWSKK